MSHPALALASLHVIIDGPREDLVNVVRRSAAWGLPLVAIGGITADNGRPLITAGARSLAVVSAVFGAPDPRLAAQRFTRLFPS